MHQALNNICSRNHFFSV